MVNRPTRLHGSYFDYGLNFVFDIRLTQKMLCFSNCKMTKLCLRKVMKKGNMTENSKGRITP